MAPETPSPDQPRLRKLLPLGFQRGGHAWESLRATVRRRTLRVLGKGSSKPDALDIRLVARLRLNLEGTRALFMFNDGLRSELASEMTTGGASFVQFIARIAGATSQALRRHSVRGEIMNRLEGLVLEETELVGELFTGLGVGPEGLWMELSDLEGRPLSEADDAELVLTFDSGLELRESLREGAGLFRAGAALMETRGLVGALVDFGEYGRVELEPANTQ